MDNKISARLGLFLCLLALFFSTAAPRTLISKGEDCKTCIANTTAYEAVCQSNYGYGASYCCTEDDMTTEDTCMNAPLCSNTIDVMSMKYTTCPHEKYPCGISTPDLKLEFGQDVTIKVQKLMGPEDICYYKVTAKDQVDLEDLDPYNRKYIQIMVKTISGLDGYVGTATNASMLDELSVTTVSSAALNFTQNISQPLWLVIEPQDGASRSDIKAEIQFRYYEYDPECAQFNKWNGTACVADYNLYCSSLTEQYREQLNNENVTVSFNGTNCVVKVINYEISEEVEYVYINVTSNETTFENKTKSFDEVFQEALLKGHPKKQLGMLVVSGSIMIGFVLYFAVDWLFETQKQKLKFSLKVKNAPPGAKHDMSVEEQKLNEEIKAINREFLDIDVEDEDSLDEPKKRKKGFLEIHHELQVDQAGVFDDFGGAQTTIDSKPRPLASVQKFNSNLPVISPRNNKFSNADSLAAFETNTMSGTENVQDQIRGARSAMSAREPSPNVSKRRQKNLSKKKKVQASIIQDYESRIKGENQFGEIDDETFTAGVHSERQLNSQADFDQAFKYKPSARSKDPQNLSEDYDESDDKSAKATPDPSTTPTKDKEETKKDSKVETSQPPDEPSIDNSTAKLIEPTPDKDFADQMLQIEKEAAQVDGGDDDEPSAPPKV